MPKTAVRTAPVRFESCGVAYRIDGHGVIHQEDPKPFVYDAAYVAVHTGKPDYGEKARALSLLRLGWSAGVYSARFDGDIPSSLVDVGYADGAFMREARKIVPRVFGVEAADVPVPDGCLRIKDASGVGASLVTFWDSFEHHPDLEFVRDLDCQMIALSVPYCHEAGGGWFDGWKHRKPNEHLHHFSPHAIGAFMEARGWKAVAAGHHEDALRGPLACGRENILSAAFVRNA